MERTHGLVLAAEPRESRSDIDALMHLSEVTREVLADMTSYFEKPKLRTASSWVKGDLQ